MAEPLLDHPDRFARVVIGNTGLPTGDQRLSDAFMAWQEFSQTTEVLDIGFLTQSATTTELTEAGPCEPADPVRPIR